MYFKSIHTKVRISRHAAIRLKERAGLNTRLRREKFISKAGKNALSSSMIPQSVFPEFFSYLKSIADNSKKRTGDDCTVLLYMDYLLVVSRFHGDIVTVLNIDPKYKGYYYKIMAYKQSYKTNKQVTAIENEAQSILETTTNLDKARNIALSIITSHGFKLNTAIDTVRRMVDNIAKSKVAVL